MKIDVTKLEGYKPEMSADEKLALIEKYDIPDPDYTGYVKKSIFDTTASELAAKKKELAAKMTEDEKKEAERLANEAAIKAELEALRKDKAVSEAKAQYIGLGYDEKLATETAQAFADGDMTKVFANQKLHIENVKKAERAAALGNDPKPPAGHNDPPKGDRAKLIEQYNEAEKRYQQSHNINEIVLMQTLDAQIKALPKE